ncbi:MAG: LPS export ABC transporter periplasmic protein LptC [Methylococcales bacterium]|nr:LPS export ABC transporter periplasmic protein LptC [Methylococcales bacterium]
MNNVSLKKSTPYFLALSLAGLSWWLVEFFRLPDDEKRKPPALSIQKSPNYFSKGYLKKEMDKNGFLKSKLAAQEMNHYSNEGITKMLKPVMTLYNSKAPPWVIRSELGILSNNGKDLQLKGKVFIHRNKSEGVRELGIETSNLNVKLKDSYAEGSEWTKISSPPHWTTGTGIQMTFKKPISLKLLANVKSYYDTK